MDQITQGTQGMRKFRQNSSVMRNETGSNLKHIFSTPTLKEEVVRAYGGRCVCCGEDQISCLQIDHIAGDGKQHRQKVRSVYGDLKRRGFPQDAGVQVLCANCHQSKTINGVCILIHNKGQNVENQPTNPTNPPGSQNVPCGQSCNGVLAEEE